MAAPMSSGRSSDADSDEESDETNFLSPNFNPLRALYSSRVQLPSPRATIFNTLREYEKVVGSGDVFVRGHADSGRGQGRGQGRGRGQAVGLGNEGMGRGTIPSCAGTAQTQAGPSGQDPTRRESRPDTSTTNRPASRRETQRRRNAAIPLGTGFRATQDMLIDSYKYKQSTFRNVLTRMSELSLGPHSVLHRCMNERCKVRVCTRSFKGLRSICTGYLVTFDKFFNMALVDVDEVWRLPSKGQRFYHEETLTFSKIMECSKVQESQEEKFKTGTKKGEEPSGKTTVATDEQPQAPCKEHSKSSAKTRPTFKLQERKHSGKSSHRDARELGQGDLKERSSRDHKKKSSKEDRDGGQKKSSHTKSKDSKERSKGRVTEEERGDVRKDEEDIDDLQQRLASLQRELMALSDDEDKSGGTSERTRDEEEGKENPESRLASLYRELTSMSDDEDDAGDSGSQRNTGDEKDFKTRTVPSGSKLMTKRTLEGQETSPTTKGKASKNKVHSPIDMTADKEPAVIQDQDKGQHSKVQGSSEKAGKGERRGRLRIKPEDFKRRHVNQLFIRGDNVVLVSVDSNILPK